MIDLGRSCLKSSVIRFCCLVSAAMITAGVSGCVTSPRFAGEIRPVSSAQIIVVRAVGHWNAAGLVIDGDVRRPNGYAGVVPGYLQVEGRDASGAVIAATKANWGEFKSRRFRLAYFHAVLPSPEPASIKIITVEAVTGPSK